MGSDYWTSKQTEVGGLSSIDVTTTTTIPASASITLTLFEDVGADGSGANTDAIGNNYDNSASVSLTGGTSETNTLTGFDGGGSTNDYWMHFAIDGDGTDPTVTTPTFSSVSFDPVGAPVASVSSFTSTSVDLSWSDTGAASYDVLRAQSTGSVEGDYTVISAGEVGTTYSDTGLDNGNDYFYRIKDNDTGQLSNEVDQITTLPATTLDSLDNSVENQVTVNFTRQDTATDGNIEIYRSTDGTLGSVVHTVTNANIGSVSSWADTTVTDGVDYYYTVRRNTTDTSTDSSQASTTTILPGATGLASASVTATSFDITWTRNDDNTTGNWEVLESAGGDPFTIVDTITTLSTTTSSFTGKDNGTIYKYKVRRNTNDTSDTTAEISVQTTLPDVTDLSVDNSTQGQMVTSWTDVLANGDYRSETKNPVDTYAHSHLEGAYGLSFDASAGDYAVASSVSPIQFDPNNDDVTISFWIMPNAVASGSRQFIFSKITSHGDYYSFIDTNGVLNWIIIPDGSSGVTTPTNDLNNFINDGEPIWVSLEFDHTSGFTMYLNNTAVASTNQTFTGAQTDTVAPDLVVGARTTSPTEGFDGVIDDFQIHGKVLTSAQRDDIYAGLHVDDTLLLRYPMNEGTGTVATDIGGNNDLTISGATYQRSNVAGDVIYPAGNAGVNWTTTIDGDAIDFRTRTETPYAHGTWDTVTSTTFLPAASGVTLDTSTAGQIGVSWTKADNNPDGDWEIYRSTDGSLGSLAHTTADASTTSWTDTGRNDATTYYYTVRRDTTDTTKDSTQVSGTTATRAPTLDSLDASTQRQITVSWTLNDDSSSGSVEVYRSQDGSLGSLVHTENTLATTTYTDTGLTDGHDYYYTVRRVDNGQNADSNQSSATTTLPVATSVSGSQGSLLSKVTLSWTKNDNASDGHWEIYYSTTSGSLGTQFNGSISVGSSSTDVTGLSGGTTYYFTVRRVTNDSSADSAQASFTTGGITGEKTTMGWHSKSDWDNLASTNHYLNFPGGSAADVVEISNYDVMPSDQITVAFWIRSTGFAVTMGIFSYAVSGGTVADANEVFIVSPHNLRAGVKGNDPNTNIHVNDGEWHRIVFTWESATGKAKTYKDGVLANTDTMEQGNTITSGGGLVFGQDQDSVLGGYDATQALEGDLDDVIIDDIAWSATQVENDYNGSAPGNLVGRWTFDEGAGTTALDSAGSYDGSIGGSVSYGLRAEKQAVDSNLRGGMVHSDYDGFSPGVLRRGFPDNMDGLIALYTFYNTDDTLTDRVNGFDGTVANPASITYNAPSYGFNGTRSWEFLGNDDSTVDLPDLGIYGNQAFSYAINFEANVTTDWKMLMHMGGDDAYEPCGLMISDNVDAIGVATGEANSIISIATSGTFDGLPAQVVLTYDPDGPTLYAYWDGTLQGSSTLASPLKIHNSRYAIGSHVNGRVSAGDTIYPMDGHISEVAWFDKTLTDGEVSDLYKSIDPNNPALTVTSTRVLE